MAESCGCTTVPLSATVVAELGALLTNEKLLAELPGAWGKTERCTNNFGLG